MVRNLRNGVALNRVNPFERAGSMRIAFGLCLAFTTAVPLLPQESAARPNILWITCEDISPNLGCYGDKYAFTPNLDRLAAQGVR